MATQPNVISQQQLERLYNLQQAASEYAACLKALKELVEDGARPAQGRYTLNVTKNPGRRSPSWKEEAIKMAKANGLDAAAYEQQVLGSTEPGAPSISIKIVDSTNLLEK